MWIFKVVNFNYIWKFKKNVLTQKQLSIFCGKSCKIQDNNEDFIDRDTDYQTLVDKYLGTAVDHKCFVIHPYVKWGAQKIRTATPEYQMEEGIALVNSLYTWQVIDKIIVPLDNFHKNFLFGTGSLTMLIKKIRTSSSVTAVFINIGTLKTIQLVELEKQFGLPIFDRYNLVMQIFRLHAITKHAKLQVALAELPYLRNRFRKHETNVALSVKHDVQHFILQTREKKLKDAIKKLRSQRELLRNKRRKIEVPIVAVVGYTNAGKTSLIKALTGDKSLIPKDKLFATLDITFHAGLLPSKQKVLYVDTIGFLSDIPTELIECFKATLEDAMLADVILHVEDLSNQCFLYQRTHVQRTIEDLGGQMDITDMKKKLINVGNKCDICNIVNEPILKVSAKDETGIEMLKEKIEEKILEITKRHVITISLPIGGNEIRWLYKNATVVAMEEDGTNSQNSIVKIIISETKLHQFQHHFVT